MYYIFFFFFSSRRRHTRFDCDWSSDVCSSDLLSTRFAREGDDALAAGRPLLGVPDLGRAGLRGRATCLWLARFMRRDRKSTRLNSSHSQISYAVFCLKKKKKTHPCTRASSRSD